MKKSVLPFVALVALTSCNLTPKLREDIKEFISQFSIDAAMAEYVSGGYTNTRVVTEGDTVTTKTIEMEFSLVDEEHPIYSEITTTNGVTETVTFVENEEGCFLSKDGVLEPSSIEECKSLITKFFYAEIINGTYHRLGYYYGDLILDNAPWFQKFITIDQENELYVYEYSTSFKDNDGVNTTKTQKYTVNKFGMLVENHDLTENINKSIKQDIYVHN